MFSGMKEAMRRSVTLQDIADHCGFSKSTVAQVLRSPERCKAAAATRKQVLAAARELGYQPNLTARSLSTRRSFTIGVMFPAVGSFYHELVIRLDAILAQHGYYGLFSYWPTRLDAHSAFRHAFDRMRQYGVDGIITCEYDESLAEEGIPIVTYGNERRLMDCVYPDKKEYAVQAVRYLYERGHRRMAFMGFFEDVRYQALKQAMTEVGVAVNPTWMIPASNVLEANFDRIREILSQPTRPTAVITHSDHLAMGVILTAHEVGKRVPDDLSVLSYDNLREAAFCLPPLTTFDQRFDLAANLLAETVIRRIETPSLPQQKRHYTMPLIERASVASPPLEA